MEKESSKKEALAKLSSPLSQTFHWLGWAAGSALAQVQQGAVVGKELAQTAIGSVQRTLGEDYQSIFEKNSLVKGMLGCREKFAGNPHLLNTALNVPWTSTLLWSAAAGSTVSLEKPISHFLQALLHDNPGHWQRWKEVNQFMDNVGGKFMPGAVGAGHRLKFGHSLEYLPQVIEQFGIEATPAFFVHLLQDAATVDGIPVVPKAWDVKAFLQTAGLSRKAATGLISVNYSGLLAAVSIVGLVSTVWEVGNALIKKTKTQNYLQTAGKALQHEDYLAAVENYQRALEVERSPLVLMALGQVYLRRATNRLRAHQAFLEAVQRLAEEPGAAILYQHASLSVRGLAGLQALATADVLADIHPEHWNDHVRDLANATVFSFSLTAKKQAEEGHTFLAERLYAPAHLSAALNYYLAAKAAAHCPFIEEQREKVNQNLRDALTQLGYVAQYDELNLRQQVRWLAEFWTRELLTKAEQELVLAPCSA